MYSCKSLTNNIQGIKSDIKDVIKNDRYYCTPEVARELTDLTKSLNALSFDNTLGLSKLSGSVPRQAIRDVADCVSDFKTQMLTENLKKKHPNQIRNLNDRAVTNFENVQEQLKPFTAVASSRNRQFGDHVGVTNRFTTYRNNLTRTSIDYPPDRARLDRNYTVFGSPSREQRVYFGGKDYGQYDKKITFNQDNTFSKVKTHRAEDCVCPKVQARGPPGNLLSKDIVSDIRATTQQNAKLARAGQQKTAYILPTPQESAGINVNYPGISEYQLRYTNKPDDSFINDFIINPAPNFRVNGRPLAFARFYPRVTEYQSTYQYPDGSKIHAKPWLRK